MHRRTLVLGASVVWLLGGLTPVPVSAQQTGPGAVPASVEAPEEMHLPAAPAVAAPDTNGQASDALSATDAFSQFRRAFDAGQYEAAVPHAKRVLQLAEAAASAPADEEVQVALMNLAMTQYLAGDYVGAEAAYTRAIELVQASGRPLHARLARAYAGLASTYHEGKRHELAVENYDRAVSLTRRHEGLLTDTQLPLLEKYIDSLTEVGRYPDALKGWKYVLRIATRKHGETSPALAPTLERIGRWYARVGLYDQARRVIRRAIDLVETAEGDESPRLVGPLTALAQCNRRQLIDPDQRLFAAPDADRATLYHDPSLSSGTSAVSPTALLAEGERALLRAAAIAEARVDASPVQVADVRTQLGDWYQSRALPERALPNYQKAWMAASRVEQRIDGKPVVEALFGHPLLLQVVRPDGWDRYASRPADQVETRNVVVEFTVSAEGRAVQPRVVDDSGDAKRAERTTAALESARYRPRLENGQPVATAGVTFTQPWILLLPTPAEETGSPARDASAPVTDKAT
ncbi:MAG TPA: tetratricopeptide repeat protein [Steroidobacteraceae bacterium]|nr:tetratricopeptide repeat protein [Steroidobacteraceae bacterium]